MANGAKESFDDAKSPFNILETIKGYIEFRNNKISLFERVSREDGVIKVIVSGKTLLLMSTRRFADLKRDAGSDIPCDEATGRQIHDSQRKVLTPVYQGKAALEITAGFGGVLIREDIALDLQAATSEKASEVLGTKLKAVWDSVPEGQTVEVEVQPNNSIVVRYSKPLSSGDEEGPNGGTEP